MGWHGLPDAPVTLPASCGKLEAKVFILAYGGRVPNLKHFQQERTQVIHLIGYNSGLFYSIPKASRVTDPALSKSGAGYNNAASVSASYISLCR